MLPPFSSLWGFAEKALDLLYASSFAQIFCQRPRSKLFNFTGAELFADAVAVDACRVPNLYWFLSTAFAAVPCQFFKWVLYNSPFYSSLYRFLCDFCAPERTKLFHPALPPHASCKTFRDFLLLGICKSTWRRAPLETTTPGSTRPFLTFCAIDLPPLWSLVVRGNPKEGSLPFVPLGLEGHCSALAIGSGYSLGASTAASASASGRPFSSDVIVSGGSSDSGASSGSFGLRASS